MATFNAKNTSKTTNLSGHAAYITPKHEQLAIMAMTSFVNEPKYYGDTTDNLIDLATEMCQSDPDFVLSLAVYVRTVANMRSSSHLLAAIACRHIKNNQKVRKMVRACVVRGDDVTNILATYKALYGDVRSNAMIRGLKDALSKFSAYDLAKYQSKSRDVSMRDALRLCHPKYSNETVRKAVEQLLNGELAFPTSWETELSAKGNTFDTWKELLDANKVPHMALLRNLRNISRAGIDSKMVADKLVSGCNGKMLPFRYYSAYNELSDVTLRDALSDCMDKSISAFPKLSGKTLIVVDESGSMSCPISMNSCVSYFNVASILAALIVATGDDCDAELFSYGVRHVLLSKRNPILTNVELMGYADNGWTDMGAPFKELLDGDKDYDRIIVLSDNEVNYYPNETTIQQYANEYRKKVGHDVWVHAWDLAGYGTQQFIGKHTNIMGGWSEKLIEIIPLVENGLDSFIEQIRSVEF